MKDSRPFNENERPSYPAPGLVWSHNGEAGDGQTHCDLCGGETDEHHGPDQCFEEGKRQGYLERIAEEFGEREAQRELCQSAVSAFGTEYQLRKTQEECCELGAAIAQYLDGKISAEELAGEAADNEITAPYVRLAIGDALVDEAKTRKLERLRGIVREKVESDQS